MILRSEVRRLYWTVTMKEYGELGRETPTSKMQSIISSLAGEEGVWMHRGP